MGSKLKVSGPELAETEAPIAAAPPAEPDGGPSRSSSSNSEAESPEFVLCRLSAVVGC